MARLVAGRPRVTDGRLTVANLAREAGVGRSTANRAVDVLDVFRAAVNQVPRQRSPEIDTAAGRSRDAAEIATLKGTVNQLAQQVQRLALLAPSSARRSMPCALPWPRPRLARWCHFRRRRRSDTLRYRAMLRLSLVVNSCARIGASQTADICPRRGVSGWPATKTPADPLMCHR